MVKKCAGKSCARIWSLFVGVLVALRYGELSAVGNMPNPFWSGCLILIRNFLIEFP